MSILANDFRDRVKKLKDPRHSEGVGDVGYPTGFTSIDFRNGTSYIGRRDGKPVVNYVLGLVDGSMNMIIGRSGSGKSTLALQIAGNIAKEFDESVIYHDDIEGGTNTSRILSLLGMDESEIESKYIYRNSGITTENIFERLKTIYDLKMANKDEFMYDTGLVNMHGEPIYKLQPTIYIVDSVAVMMPEKYAEEDEMSGNMGNTATAKENKKLASRLLHILKPANIIMIFINHINDDVQIGLVPKKPMLPYLKQGETLPGGKGFHYLMNNVFRIDDGTKLKDSDKFQIDGNVTQLSLCKSRTNKSGKAVPLIFNQTTGFDNDLSLLQLLVEHKKINGAGAYLYIDDRDDKKFSNKKFKELCMEDDEFYDILVDKSIEVLRDMVSYNNGFENVKPVRRITSNIVLSKLNS